MLLYGILDSAGSSGSLEKVAIGRDVLGPILGVARYAYSRVDYIRIIYLIRFRLELAETIRRETTRD